MLSKDWIFLFFLVFCCLDRSRLSTLSKNMSTQPSFQGREKKTLNGFRSFFPIRHSVFFMSFIIEIGFGILIFFWLLWEMHDKGWDAG